MLFILNTMISSIIYFFLFSNYVNSLELSCDSILCIWSLQLKMTMKLMKKTSLFINKEQKKIIMGVSTDVYIMILMWKEENNYCYNKSNNLFQ